MSTLNESKLLEKTLECSIMQKLTESMTEAIEKSLPSPPSIDLTGLETRLDELSKEIQEFKSEHLVVPQIPHIPVHSEPDATPVIRATLKSPEKPYDTYEENFLSNEELSDIADFLNSLIVRGN